MRDIILIQPKTRWSEQITKNHPLTLPIPTSLLTIASYIKEEFNVIILDQRIEPNWEKTLYRHLSNKPLLVGLTAMTGRQIHYALQASGFVKKHSKVPVVWGGPHASLLPEQTLESPLVDYVIIGEGEKTILELAEKLEVNGPVSDIAGLGYKKMGKIILNKGRPFIKMDNLPPIPYDLIDMEKYLSKKFQCRPVGIPTTRGCPNKCAFCYDTNVHKSCWRAFSAERTLEEIDKVVKDFDANFIYFFESNSFVDINRIKKIARGLIERNYNLTWEGLAEIKTLRKVDYDFYSLLEKSGLRALRIGIESGSQRILDLIHKDLTPDEALRVNRMLSRFNIIPYYSFMNGFPSETNNELKQSVDLMFKLLKENKKARFGPINTLMPYPGTELYDVAIKNGFEPPKRLQDWIQIDSFDVMKKASFRMPWISKNKSKKLERMFYLSLFMDDKSEAVENKFLNLVFNSYKPIAEFRLKNHILDFMPEYHLYNLSSR